MNVYMNKNEDYNSNNRIIEAYFTENARPAGALQKALDSLLAFLYSVLQAISLEKICRGVKILSTVGCLLGLLGTVCAIENDTLGIGMGLLLGSALILIEYLCLKSHRS